MNRWSLRFGAVAVVAVMGTASAVHAADSCLAPCAKVPKKSRHVSTVGFVALPAGPMAGPILTTPGATLAKGNKKKVVTVDATITSGMPVPMPMILSMGATLNGVAMEPTTGVYMDCAGTAMTPWFGGPLAGCTVSATFWLDLDQAETASPGTFIGLPLTVVLVGGDASGMGGPPVSASMNVRQEGK